MPLEISPQVAAVIGDKIFDILALMANERYAKATLALDELHDALGRIRYPVEILEPR